MALFNLTEAEERQAMRDLFLFIHETVVGDKGAFSHNFESFFELVYRFFTYFDPEGSRPDGYEQIMPTDGFCTMFDSAPLQDLPCLKAFLNVALKVNDHYFGSKYTMLTDQVVNHPGLLAILKRLGLADENNMPGKALILNGIDEYKFHNGRGQEFKEETEAYLSDAVDELWQTASVEQRKSIISHIDRGHHPLRGINFCWLGEWLSDAEQARFPDDFWSIHAALEWMIPQKLVAGVKSGKYSV